MHHISKSSIYWINRVKLTQSLCKSMTSLFEIKSWSRKGKRLQVLFSDQPNAFALTASLHSIYFYFGFNLFFFFHFFLEKNSFEIHWQCCVVDRCRSGHVPMKALNWFNFILHSSMRWSMTIHTQLCVCEWVRSRYYDITMVIKEIMHLNWVYIQLHKLQIVRCVWVYVCTERDAQQKTEKSILLLLLLLRIEIRHLAIQYSENNFGLLRFIVGQQKMVFGGNCISRRSCVQNGWQRDMECVEEKKKSRKPTAYE